MLVLKRASAAHPKLRSRMQLLGELARGSWGWCSVAHVIITSPYQCLKKHSSGEEDPLDDQLEKHKTGGWRGVAAAIWQGRGSRRRSVFHRDR